MKTTRYMALRPSNVWKVILYTSFYYKYCCQSTFLCGHTVTRVCGQSKIGSSSSSDPKCRWLDGWIFVVLGGITIPDSVTIFWFFHSNCTTLPTRSDPAGCLMTHTWHSPLLPTLITMDCSVNNLSRGLNGTRLSPAVWKAETRWGEKCLQGWKCSPTAGLDWHDG